MRITDHVFSSKNYFFVFLLVKITMLKQPLLCLALYTVIICFQCFIGLKGSWCYIEVLCWNSISTLRTHLTFLICIECLEGSKYFGTELRWNSLSYFKPYGAAEICIKCITFLNSALLKQPLLLSILNCHNMHSVH